MKNKISAVFMSAASLLVCASFVAAGELLAFDTVYKNPQAALKTQASVVSEAHPQALVEDQGTMLPTMGEFLRDVPKPDRLEFLNSLMLKNGHIVSAYLAPLKRNLSEERVKEILDAIYVNRGLARKLSFDNPGAESRFTELSELLKDVPQAVRDEFLDNLVFKDGAFASAYVGGLRKTLGADDLKGILRALATNPNTPADPKSLCWDGTCENAKCAHFSDHWGCKSTDVNWSCDTSCK